MKWRKNWAQRDLLDEFGAFLLSLREIFIHHFLPKSPSGRNICIELLLPPQPDGLPVSNTACLTVFLYFLWYKVAGKQMETSWQWCWLYWPTGGAVNASEMGNSVHISDISNNCRSSHHHYLASKTRFAINYDIQLSLLKIEMQ